MSRISVVLHRPIYPRNVGMCARAMANMGLSRLVIVAPRAELNEQARQGAAHAQSVLREAKVYPSLAEFLAADGDGIRIAMSGKDGRLKRPDGLDTTLERMVEDVEHPFHDGDVPIHLVFGPEDDGLSNEEMELCNFVCRLPTFGEITSLNLSHAVLLASYMTVTSLRRTSSPEVAHLATDDESKPEPKGVYYPGNTIKLWLEALGFDLSARRVSIEKTLNRILLSRCPNQEELRIIDAILQQTVRKLGK